MTQLPRLRRDRALFLDLDGTLLDLAPTPDAVAVPPDLRRDLKGLHAALGGALALVSGRGIADVDRILAPLRLPVAGQHGAEMRATGDAEITHPVPDVDLGQLRRRLTAFAAAHPGVVVEDKGRSVTAHYRQAPRYRDELRKLMIELVAETGDGLEILDARMAFDAKSRSVNKRLAVEWFMRRPPFLGRSPVFAGDDTTDEDGFAAVLALSGDAIRVGTDADSIAQWRAAAPQEIRQWLRNSIAELDGE